MTFFDFTGNRSLESQWMKVILISLGLHTLLLAFFLNIFPQSGMARRLEPTYFVNLVTAPGGGLPEEGMAPQEKAPAPPPKAESQPLPKAEPSLPKAAPAILPKHKEEDSRSLDQALEHLKKKVQEQKSLDTKLSKLEDKVKNEEALQQTLAQLEKKKQADSGSARPATGTAGTGSGSISSGTAGNPDGLGIQFQLYHAALRVRIKRNWVLPEGLLKRNDISAEIMVRIGRNGRIEDTRFERKSGVEGFDQEVIRTLKKSDPLPPVPEGYPRGSYEIILTFHSKDLSN